MTSPPSPSLPIGRKKGRPPDPLLGLWREAFPEWSERTLARYVKADRQLQLMGQSKDQVLEVVRRSLRPNGTINVSKFCQMAESMVAMWIFDHDPAGQVRA